MTDEQIVKAVYPYAVQSKNSECIWKQKNASGIYDPLGPDHLGCSWKNAASRLPKPTSPTETQTDGREGVIEQYITRRSGSYYCNVCGYAVANGHILIHDKIAGGVDCPVGLLMAKPVAAPTERVETSPVMPPIDASDGVRRAIRRFNAKMEESGQNAFWEWLKRSTYCHYLNAHGHVTPDHEADVEKLRDGWLAAWKAGQAAIAPSPAGESNSKRMGVKG